ncbi:hypothetical protein GEMRC1_008138 [Eukaryota sp. GEM-RC1]
MEPIYPAAPSEIYDIPHHDIPSSFIARKVSTKYSLGGTAQRSSNSYITSSDSPGKYYYSETVRKISPKNTSLGTSPRFPEIKVDSPGRYYSPELPKSPRSLAKCGTLGSSPRFTSPKSDSPGVFYSSDIITRPALKRRNLLLG